MITCINGKASGMESAIVRCVNNSKIAHGNHGIDLVPLHPDTGKGQFTRALAIEVAVAFYEAGYQLNIAIRWGGMWAEFEDIPHIEIPDPSAKTL